MSGSMMHDVKAEPNLTPMLDMVFQLITFFMLVINFSGASLDLSLQLPVLGSARPLNSEGDRGMLVLNIDTTGRLKVYGIEKEVKTYIAEEARVEAARRSTRDKPVQLGDELPTMVVIRADRATPFKTLNDIIATCQQYGFRRYALRVMNRAAGGGG